MATRLPAGVGRLLERLATPETAEALVALAVQFGLDQPVRTYVDPARALSAIDHALAPAQVERWVTTHLADGLARDRARWHAHAGRVGDFLCAEARAEARALASRPVQLDPKFLRQIVQQEAVQHMLRSVIEETLDRFVNTFKPGGSGGGLAGSLGRSAFGFARKAGGGLMGGIAEQIEAQLKKGAAGFVHGSMDLILERTVAILSSPEMQRQMGRSAVALFDGALALPVKSVAKAADTVDLDDILDTLPGQVAHLLARDDLRQVVLDEVEAFLAVEGDQPLRALFVDEAALAGMIENVTAVAVPWVQRFAGTDEFKAWLGDATAK